MLKQITKKLLELRHPWREFDFNELNELYVAMLVRGMSLSMMGLFVPIFLMKIGFTLTAILSVLCIYFIVRIFTDIAAGFLVARFGPKHIMVLGQLLFVTSSILYLTQEHMHWPLILLGGVWGASQSCFFVSFDVDFSKIKHSKNGGKELGYIGIMTKLGAIIGPLLGGIISLLFGPEYIFAVSTVLLMVGLIPLFKTKEPVRLRQKLDFKGFDLDKATRNLPAIAAIHLENTLSLMTWPLFLAYFVLPGDSVFIKVGILSAVAVSLAMITDRVVGGLVDKGKGRRILRFSAITNALLHLLRPLVNSFPLAFGLGIANETVTVGYRLPFFKGFYDLTDDFPGYRIVLISIMECFSSFIKAGVYGSMALLSTVYSPWFVFTVGFIIAAISSLVIATERFRSLKPEQKA